ncbi:MAG: hypothetical protein FWG53_06635 [Clostridiales bacterium]|nr:hypothetical protein [Clostridiales bacterium]
MDDFCNRCGNPLPGDGSPCPCCNPALPPEIEVEAPKTEEALPPQADKAFWLGGREVKVSTVVQVVAVLLVVLFFLPWFTVNCQGVRISFNGLDVAFGKTVTAFGSSQRIEGKAVYVVLLLIPAVQFLALLLNRVLPAAKKALYAVSTGLSALGVLGFAALTSYVGGIVKANMIPLHYTAWYILSIALHVAAGAVSAWCAISLKKRE